jgi:hypothetical protein
MEGPPHHSDTDRQSVITIFIVIYVICIACALVPLIMLFGLPDNVTKNTALQLGKSNEKQQKETLEKYDSLVASLETMLKENKVKADYRLAVDEMNRLSENVKKSGNPYHVVFKRVTYLYDEFEKTADKLATIDTLKAQLNAAQAAMAKQKEEMDKQKTKMEFMELQLQLAGSKQR